MNTGWVGGDEEAEARGEALKVKIRHSSAILQALADGRAEWETDPDFGYDVAKAIDGVPIELLQPRRFYEAKGRGAEYRDLVARLHTERRSFLEKFKGLDPAIVDAV